MCSRHSGCGTVSAWECPAHTVQESSQMRQGTGQFQYHGAIQQTHSSMQDYPEIFYKMKDIFLEFQVTNSICVKIKEQRRELRHDRPKTRERIASWKRRCIRDAEREEETNRRINLIVCESHFNFMKLHLLSHLADHIHQFGKIPMYSTEFGELAHKSEIKAG